MIREFKIELINEPNDKFIDVFYSFKGLFFRYTDVVSIHVSNKYRKELDGYGLLSKKYNKSINSNKKLLQNLKRGLKRKGWNLLLNRDTKISKWVNGN